MLKKLNLKQADKYEIAFATHKIALMLVAYIQGRPHDICIGSEQGGIAKWDDFVIENAKGTKEYIQVKRQNTNFNDDCSFRDKIVQGERKGVFKDLSPLDESILSLAEWARKYYPEPPNPICNFFIVLPVNNIKIKKEFTIRNFAQFCNIEINSLSNVRGIESLAEENSHVRYIYDWLTTWCGFADWDHILHAIKHLKILITGNEEEFNSQTESILGTCFSNPEKVRTNINSFSYKNSNFTSVITPRAIFSELYSFLLPDISTWTQYHNIGNDWQISGTHDMSLTNIERAAPVVSSLWNPERRCELKFHAPIKTKDSLLSKAVIRMVLHLNGLANAQITSEDTWREISKNYVGGTIGVKEDDYEDINAFDCSVSFTSSDARDIDNLEKLDAEADSLNWEMYRTTWAKICSILTDKISNLPPSELRNAIAKRWSIWRNTLTMNEPKCFAFCKSMLHPTAESENILADIRVGPKTVPSMM